MTKAFTALTVLELRDQGRWRLDAPASDYVPELRAWKYPTDDSPVGVVVKLWGNTRQGE